MSYNHDVKSREQFNLKMINSHYWETEDSHLVFKLILRPEHNKAFIY